MRRILIAEDDSSMRTMLGRMIRLFGYEVREAADGAEALQLLEIFCPDILLLDMRMPTLDGIDTLSAIGERRMPVRVVAMSGNVEVDSGLSLDLARKLGAIRVLAKPFTMRELEAVLHETSGEQCHTI